MPWSSKVPAAIEGLVVAFAAWPGLAKVKILDGPTTSQQTLQEVLTVGWTGGEDDSDAESTLLTEGLGGAADREQFTIRCAAAVLRGTDDLSGARRRAYELLTEAGAAIAQDRRLRGAVMRAMVASHSLSQELTQQGAQAVVVFEVSCDAYSGA
ncbi:hypothetical protein [Streptomyces cyanogenus]|uniref:DUF3168 domain-containing protein n=1 Tax=Streptomyces cyanogenus TaxID=80860 RepID=A0ABX7TK59_STRCY|nr:hypothetical protein [Streptomyces cyanogenus]QTD96971.1 hypothetical protein S1361_06380 [Streptomyces cyanogenus]